MRDLERLRLDIGDGEAVDGDAARLRVVEAQEQVEDRALAGARRADDGDRLAAPDRETHPVEGGDARARRVGEAHVLEGDGRRAAAPAAASAARAARSPERAASSSSEPLGRAGRLRDLAPHLGQLGDGAGGEHGIEDELAEPAAADLAADDEARAEPQDADDAGDDEE